MRLTYVEIYQYSSRIFDDVFRLFPRLSDWQSNSFSLKIQSVLLSDVRFENS